MTRLEAYLALTKPRLLPMVLLSGLPALLLAAGGWPGAERVLATLLGTAVAAGAANALNSYLERERDALMERTRTRPLPAGVLTPRSALGFGLALGVVSLAMLGIWTRAAAAGIALAGILFYVFVYTLWLKPRTPLAVILGGVSGAVAPLIADAAVDGRVGAAGLLLFAIVFAWQPPHFYAISLYRAHEFERAGFPMLAGRIGEAATRRRILYWGLAMIALTLAPAALGLLGTLYGLAALAIGAGFLRAALRLLRERTPEAARGVFRASLWQLMGLLLAMLVDIAARGLLA
jgi:protoheme IX farnesyltransferase